MSCNKDEKKHVCDVWGHINPEQVGADALCRLMYVYPWTTKLFKKFGDLSFPERNVNVAHHGAKVLKSVGEAIQHIDNLKAHYADLSVLHSQKFHVDPANFRLFAGIVSIVVGLALGHEYTAHKQAAFEKFMHNVERALSAGYC